LNYLLSLVHLSHAGQAWLETQSRAMPCLIVVNIWAGFPFQMLILLAALQTVPKEQLEAAVVDGSSGLQRLWHVIVPNIRFIIALVLIIGIIGQTQNYLTVDILTQGGPGNATETAVYYIYQVAFVQFNFGEAAAMSVVLLVCLLVVMGLLLRFVGRGEKVA
jgi:multiple sugar transport system permease protein